MSTFVGYLISKKPCQKIAVKTIIQWLGGIKGTIPFSKDIPQKMSIIPWVEFELAYYDVGVKHVNQYADETPTKSVEIVRNIVMILEYWRYFSN